MIGDVRMHRTDDAKIIRMHRRLLEQFADLQPTLSIASEAKGAWVKRSRGPFGARCFTRHRLASVLQNRWLGVERIDVGGTAIAKDVDQMLGARRKV